MTLALVLSFKEQTFTIYFIPSENTLRDECRRKIEEYFVHVNLIELSADDLDDFEDHSATRSILLIDALLPDSVQQSLFKFFANKIPIIWITESSNLQKALSLLDNGTINNICFIDEPTSIITNIIRELRGALIRSQLQVLSEQSTLISEAALNTNTSVITTDAHGDTIWVNKAHTELSGYSLDEMLGKKPGELLQGPETDPATVAYIREKLKEAIPFSTEIVNYHKNGTKYWLKLDITPVFKNGRLERYIAFQEDITEKKANELMLAESLERLQDAQRIGKMCDWVMDAHTYVISWSGRASEILELDEISGFDYWKFRRQLTFASRQKLHVALLDMRQSQKEYDLVLDFKSLDGRKKVLRTIGVPVFEDNKLSKVVGIVQDITEQYEAENLALKSKQHLVSVTDNMQAGVCRIIDKLDGTREVIFVNQGFYDMYELSEEEVKSDFSNVMKLLHPDDKVLNIREIFTEVQKTGQAVHQYFRIITKFGKLKWMHLISNAHAGSNGDIIHDFIVTDITARIQKDRLLEEISEVSLNGGWELDMLTNKLTWTDVTKQIHEVPLDFEPDVETAINFYKEGKSRDLITEFFTEVITTGKSRDGQFEIITAKGNHKWVRAKGAAEYAGDQIVRVYGFFQDITETVTRENEIIESLNEKNALLGEIHHRVKNNLAVISGLLQLELMKGDDAKLSLEDAVNRIQSIATVHEILYNTDNFSVIYLDQYLEKLTLNIAKTNPSFISDIELVSEIEKVGISINQAVPVGLLLNELITNSLKHAFNGSEKGSITISVSNIGESQVKLMYSDSGTGFDDALLENGSSLGYKLINSLLLQLEATHSIETKNGFKLECSFKSQNVDANSQLLP